MKTRAVGYVAIGKQAGQCAARSVSALYATGFNGPVVVAGDHPVEGATRNIAYTGTDSTGRETKLNMYEMLGGFDCALYLDADTIPQTSITTLFEILEAGWDVMLAYSQAQGGEAMWHIGAAEKDATLEEIGNPLPLALQAGVIGWRRGDHAQHLFAAWDTEWRRWHDQDQAALLRAYARVPECRIWLLGRDWNGGALIQHHYGAARAQ